MLGSLRLARHAQLGRLVSVCVSMGVCVWGGGGG